MAICDQFIGAENLGKLVDFDGLSPGLTCLAPTRRPAPVITPTGRKRGKVTSERTSDAPRTESAPPIDGGLDRGDQVARTYLRISVGFLALGALLLALAAGRLVYPDALSTVSFLSYGRLAPVAFNLITYGWLTIGLIGAGFFVLPRVSGKRLRLSGLALVGGGLLAAGVLLGSAGVALGGNEGRQYLEFPLWADVVIALGLIAVARVFTATIAQPSNGPLAPAEWYFGTAPVWLLMAHIVGNVPGLTGVNSVLQTTFFRGALFGLWFAAAGIGVVYYLVSSITGRDPRRVTQLTVAGFWSLAAVFALSSGSRLTYTAAPDWIETIAGLFSIALFLPVVIILVDVATALRGVRADSSGPVLRLLVAGGVSLAIIPVVNLGLSIRSSSAVLGLTDWVTAVDLLAVLGAFSFWLFALVHHVFIEPGRGKAHYFVTVTAVVVAVGSLLISGVQAGLTWIAAANSGGNSAGDGFEATVDSVKGLQWVRFVALALFAAAQIWLLVAVRKEHSNAASADVDAAEHGPAPDQGEERDPVGHSEDSVGAGEDDLGGLPIGVPVTLGRLRSGATLIFLGVALFAFGFPALEAEHGRGTALADEIRTYESGSLVDEGRSVYIAEGCWYCHTQEVRGIVTDVRLGPVARAGDYANEAPSSAGVARVGPDLMFAGSRDLTTDWVDSFLDDPRSIRPWSTMPAHDYLGSADRRAVAAYVASLRIFDFE